MLGHLLISAMLALPAPTQSGLEVEARVTDPAKAVVVLTNAGNEPCQVVGGSGLGTLAFTSVTQGGKPIAALPLEVSFGDGMQLLLSQRLVTLEPGKSLEVPLATVKGGPTGLALEMVTWSQTAGVFGALYPIEAGAPVSVELTYHAPVTGDGKTPICPAAHSKGTNAMAEPPAAERPVWMVVAVAAGGGVLLLGVLLVIFLLRRRKRNAAAAVAVLMVAALGLGTQPRSAHATITNVDPSTQAAFDECMGVFRQPGNDPAGILPALDAPGVDVTVRRPASPGDTHEAALDANTILIFWDPDNRHRYYGSGGNADPCTSLYHELHHGWQHNQGTYSMAPCATTDRDGRTLPQTEVEATRAQNLLRERLGLPQRDHYGDIPLPGECRPPAEQARCEGTSCGDSNGDPHLLTYDGRRYDFQAVGEFWLSREVSGGYEVQVRQQPAANSRMLALNTAVAMRVGSHRVEVRITAQGMVLLVDGQAKELKDIRLDGARIDASGRAVVVEWEAKGPKAFVRPIGKWGLHLALQPVPAQAGKLEGLLGDFDGDSRNDIRPWGGNPIEEPTFSSLYPLFADSWRIEQKNSLFTYDAGTNTETYMDRSLPEREVKIDALPGRAAAEAVCRRSGVTDATLLAGCIVDVAMTGQADFAAALGAGQAFTGGADFGGQTFLLRLARTGDTASAEFDGTAGQQVFIDVPAATLANSCGVLTLVAPDGQQLRNGCVINGLGHIDSTTLPSTGRYKVTVEARNAPGDARLRVITIKDVTGTLTPDGPATPVRVDKPGMVGRFTFTGRRDQKVYLRVTRATLSNECGLLSLRKPDGSEIRSGCVINGSGELDATVLPEDGVYTVQVDPNGRAVGEASLKLVNAIDQRGTLTVNGPAVTAKVQQPGAEAFFSFTGAAGQRVFIEATSTGLPSQCGLLDLRGPSGTVVVSGCLIGGKGGIAEKEGYLLKETGTYTVIVDPAGEHVGEVVLKVRG